VLLALADGHGSRRSPRSGRGADLAVDLACDLWSKDASGEDLAERLVRDWVRAVEEELRLLPIDPTEPDEADAGPGTVAYGSTLLAAVLSGAALFLQLGDGDIVVAEGDRPVVRPLPGDPHHVGEDTASLCLPAAATFFRSVKIPLAPDQPVLVLLATDGYAKSFATDAGFLQVASDLQAMILDEGLDRIGGHLQGWLREVSDKGSGDDVTAGLAWSPAPG